MEKGVENSLVPSQKNGLENQAQGESKRATGCILLIGPDDGKLQEVQPSMEMIMASSFIEKLLANCSSDCPPNHHIRIRDVKPKIFQMIIDYVRMGQIKTIICEEILDILIAADILEMDYLKSHCMVLLQQVVTVSNIWLVLSKLMAAKNLKQEGLKCCTSLLRKKTKQCLDHPSFISATSESVNLLLEQDELSLSSEWELCKYCLHWAKSKGTNARASFRKVIGKLRLLTLSLEHIVDIPSFVLSPDEFKTLYENCFSIEHEKIPKGLCDSKIPRAFMLEKRKLVNNKGLHFEFQEKFITKAMLAKSVKAKSTPSEFTNLLLITPNKDILLTRFTFLMPMNTEPSPEEATELPEYQVSVIKNGTLLGSSLVNQKPSSSTLCLKVADDLPEGKTTQYEFKVNTTSPNQFNNIFSCTVKPIIQRELDTKVFKTITVEASKNVPFIVQKIKYCIA